MTQWTIQIETTSDGRYRWRHQPAEGAGAAHAGDATYETSEAALKAGEAALARHHEQKLGGTAAEGDGRPETPDHDEDTRLGDSQAKLEAEEDPRLQHEAGVALSALPVEAEIRAADEEGSALLRR